MFHRSSNRADSRLRGHRGLLGALVLALALTVPPALQAQGGQGQQKETLMELRQANQQLNKIRKRAMQDSALLAQRQEVFDYVLSEMRSLDDSTAARVDRLTTLQEELQTAQQEQDTAAARGAVKELKKLQRALGPAQKKVMKRPAVQKRMKAFQQALQEQMSEIDPRADSLRNVVDSISSQLQGGMGGPGGGR